MVYTQVHQISCLYHTTGHSKKGIGEHAFTLLPKTRCMNKKCIQAKFGRNKKHFPVKS